MNYEVLRLNHISRAIDGQIINDISFNLYSREALCILSEDLDTKNFLLDFLQGKADADQGILLVHDCQRRLFSPDSARKLGIYVINDNQLVSSMNVADNLYMTDDAFYGKLKFLKRRALHVAARKLLCNFSLDSIKTSALVKSLSYTDRYILAILRAYVNGAKILVLDTPSFIFFHPAETKKLQKIVSILKDQGISLLWFSNKWNPVFQNFDRFATIQNGVVTRLSKLTTIPPVVAEHSFMNATFHLFMQDPDKQNIILEGRDISAPQTRNKRISFALYQGEILGICDNNQSLTRFFNDLADCRHTKTGTVLIEGQIYSTKQQNRNKIAFILPSSNPNRIFPQMNLIDNVSLLLTKPMYNTPGFLNRRIQNHIAHNALKSIQADYLLSKYGLEPKLYGMNAYDQFMVETAKWLCLNPKVFVFSDPSTIYDNLSEDHFMQLLNKLQGMGISILLISRSEEYLSKFCTRMITV